MPATYEPIATTTLSTTATTISFTSISSGFTDLRLVVIGNMSSSTGYWGFRLNNDATALYSITALTGNGSAASSARLTSANAGYINFSSTIGTSISFGTLDIFNYAGSTNKTCLAEESNDLNGAGEVYRSVYLWRNTAAINTITILPFASPSFSLRTGTTATLYGILRA